MKKLGKLYLKEIEERYNKLTKGGQSEWQQGYNKGDLSLVKDADAYELLKDIFDEENLIREDYIMVEKIIEGKLKEEEGRVKEIAEKSGDLVKTGNELSIRTEMTFEEIQKVSKFLYDSRYFSDVTSISQAFAKVQCGRELGLPPFYSMQHIFIIPGKAPATDAQGMGAVIKGKGFDYKQIELNDQRCSLRFFDPKGNILGDVTFTYDEACKIMQGGKRLVDKDVWKNYRQDMMWARCLSRGARRFCPHVISGLYLKEELDYEDAVIVNNKIEVEVPNQQPKQLEKPAEQKSVEKTRKEILDDLVVKHTKEKLSALKKELEIAGSLLQLANDEWDNFVKVLETPVKEKIEKPELKKEDKKVELQQQELEVKKPPEVVPAEVVPVEVVNKFSREEKIVILEEIKTNFGVTKIKEIKDSLKLEGKLLDLNDIDFERFTNTIKGK